MASKQRISYVPLEKMTPEMRAEMERCAKMGTPRPESSAVRAHVPGAFWSFANSWRDIFHTGVCDHAIKELARLYVSRSVTCEFCGNQRSIKAADAGKVNEAKVDELMNFEKSTHYGEREKAALVYAEAITWRLDTDDKFWARMRQHFSEPELVELGCFIALTMGQQSWLRLLNIEHHQVMVGTSASMAPGFESAEALAKSKASSDYWARKKKSAA
jgi:alkylhydroperoxidase family enzyme